MRVTHEESLRVEEKREWRDQASDEGGQDCRERRFI